MKVKKAIIPVAGFGTRFLPATKAMAKEILPIVDTPTIHYIVKEIVDSGIQDILLITSRSKKAVEDYFDRAPELEMILSSAHKDRDLQLVKEIASMANVVCVRQQEMKGSADAVMKARSFTGNEPFAMLYGDDLIVNKEVPCTAQLIHAYDTTGKTIVGVQKVRDEDVSKYGICKVGMTKGRYSEMLGFVEKPTLAEAPSRLASMGRYVLTSEIYDRILQLKPQPGKELYVTDAIDAIARDGGVFAYEFEGLRYDIGDKLGFLKATVDFALERPELREEFLNYLRQKI